MIRAYANCPNGLGAVISEFVDKGLDKYLSFDETGTPTGLNYHISRIYPTDASDMISPTIVHMVMADAVANELLSHTWTSVDIIWTGPAGGVWDEVEERIIKPLEIIAADPIMAAKYETYHTWGLYLDANGLETDVDTGTRNPRAWATLPQWDDVNSVWVEVANSQYQPLKPAGGFA